LFVALEALVDYRLDNAITDAPLEQAREALADERSALVPGLR
jgi:hypothetical protein